MIARLVSWSARHHWTVIIVALGVAIGGDLARRGLARDVVPDLADPQIALVADWMGHPAPDVAAAVAKPLTQALADVPGAKAIRASTKKVARAITRSLGCSPDSTTARPCLEKVSPIAMGRFTNV